VLEEGVLVAERGDRPVGDAPPGLLNQIDDVVLAHLGDPLVQSIGARCLFVL